MALTGITGAWLDPKKADGARGRVLRNVSNWKSFSRCTEVFLTDVVCPLFPVHQMTVTPYKSLSLRSVSGKPLEVPFDFYPEFKPQTLGIDFRLLVVDGQTGKKHSIPAYTGSVTVIEPAKNWLDPQLWSLYLIGAALVAAAGYFALQQLAPKTKGSKRTGGGSAASGKTPVVTASSTSVNAKGYDEDWIPEHHLKKSSSRIRSDDGLSSGDEGRKSPSGKRRGGRK